MIDVKAYNGFSSDRKTMFLSYIETHPNSILAACKAVGIDQVTYYKHMREDTVFSSRFKELKAQAIEKIEQTLFECAQDKNHTIDRIFFLKAWKPNIYNPALKIESTMNVNLNIGSATTYLNKEKVIEAETSETDK